MTKKNKKINKSSHPHYNRWRGMLNRCGCENHPAYQHYGGRGLDVCDEWKEDFWAYVEHIERLRRWDGSTSLDRIDNDKGYYPGNLRWTDQQTQVRNRRNWNGRTRGVYPHSGKWQVSFRIDGKLRHFGTFKLEEEATKVATFTYDLITNSL